MKILQVFTVTLLCIKYCLCEFDNVDQSLLHDNEFDVKPGGMTQSFKETWVYVCVYLWQCLIGSFCSTTGTRVSLMLDVINVRQVVIILSGFMLLP